MPSIQSSRRSGTSTTTLTSHGFEGTQYLATSFSYAKVRRAGWLSRRIPSTSALLKTWSRYGQIRNVVEPKYLFAVLRSKVVRNRIDNMHVGTLIPHFKKGDFGNLLIPVPDRADQRFIGDVYFELSAKLESARRAVDCAEALAGALFERAAAATTFQLHSVADIVMGSSPPGTSYNEVGVGTPFYQGVRDFGRRYPSHRVWTTDPVRFAKENDTLLSVRAPVGELNRAWEECCIGRGVAAVRSRTPSTAFYACCKPPKTCGSRSRMRAPSSVR